MKAIICLVAAFALNSISALKTESFIVSSNQGGAFRVSDVKSSSTQLQKSSASSLQSNQGSYVRAGNGRVSAGQYDNRAAARADSLNYSHNNFASHKASGYGGKSVNVIKA